jgi:hypothetical protein
MKDHERSSDAIIARVEQKLDDHVNDFSHTKEAIKDWQDNHVEWCKAEISRLDSDIHPMRTAFRKFETPVRWIGWTVIAVLAGMLAMIGDFIGHWFGRHWGQ